MNVAPARETVPFDVPIRLRTDGDDLVARGVRVVADGGELRLTFDVDVPTYLRIDLEGLLHLTDDVRGPGAAAFEPNGSVRIEARVAGSDAGSARDLADELLAGPDAAGVVVLDADRCYVLRVSTPTGDHGVHAGYRTAWDGAPPGGRPMAVPMLELAAAYLDEQGWDHEDVDDEPALRWDLANATGAWTAFALARDEQGRFAVYSRLPGRVPEDRRSDAAVALTRLNHGLPAGNWELDLDTGVVRFKTALDTGGDRPTYPLIAAVIERNLTTVDGQLPQVQPLLEA